MPRKRKNSGTYQKPKEVREIERDLYTPKYRPRVTPTKRSAVDKETVKEWMDQLYRPLE